MGVKKHLPLRWMENLEQVDSEENFTDDEISMVLFDDTQDRRNANLMADFVQSCEEDDEGTQNSDGDDDDHRESENFRDGYVLRGKPWKARNSYSRKTKEGAETNSPGKRPMFPTLNQRRKVGSRRK